MFKSTLAMLSMLSMAALVSALVPGHFSAARAATISKKCASGTVTVSTGTNTGACITIGGSVSCSDKGTKVSSGNCTGDKATCGDASGAGTCTITLEGTGKPPKVKVPSGKTEGGALRN